MAVEDFVFSNSSEEWDNMNPSIKKMYDTGLESSPEFYNELGLDNINSFYKLDLNNMNPEKYDSEIINRNREQNGWKYGWYGSVASTFELLSSIPGGIDRLRDWGLKTLGYEPTTDGYLDKLHEYLDDVAQGFTPEERGIAAPTTFGGKVAAGFAAAPLTIAQFIPAVRLTKSLTIGSAATEFIRTMDDGNLMDITKATAMGGMMGGIIGAANRARLPLRVATLGATGFFSAGWNASMEDRWAAATVWASLGALPVKSLDKKNMLFKPDTKEMAALKELGKSTELVDPKGRPFDTIYNNLVKTKAEASATESLLKAHAKAIEKDKAGKELKPEEQTILTENTKLELEQKLKQYDASITAQEKALFTIKDVSKRIVGEDKRTADQIRMQLRKADDTAAHKDMDAGIGQTASVFLKPGKFQDQPLFKWVVDKTNKIMKEGEALTDAWLYDFRLVPSTKNGKKVLFPGKTDKETLNDFFRRTDTSIRHFTSYLSPFKTKHYIQEKSPDAPMTMLEQLISRDWKKAEQLKDASYKIEIEKAALAGKNNESYATRDLQNNKFKYEVTDAELKSKYKFDNDMIKIYRDIRGMLDKAGETWNKAVIKSTGNSTNKSTITKLPNYMPHVFKGDFRIWINQIDASTGKTKPVAAYSANNKLGIQIVKSRLKKDKPEYFDTSKYQMVIKRIERSQYEKFEVDAFFDTLRALDLQNKPAELSTLQNALYKYGQAGFERFAKQRQGIEGFLGHERGLEGVINFKEAIRTYVTGAAQATKRLELNDVVQKAIHEAPATYGKAGLKSLATLYPNATTFAMKYKDNATGQAGRKKAANIIDTIGADWIGESGLAKVLGGLNLATLQIKLLFGNARFLAAQGFQPYHMIFPKLVDLQVKGFDKGSIAKAQLQSFRDLFFPSKEAKEAIEFFASPEVRLVEPKFLREFSSVLSFRQRAIGKNIIDFNKIAEFGTLQKMSALVEQTSRQNAGMMFFNFLRTAGVEKTQAMKQAAWLADKYMVEYNHIERPMIYGEQGMGTAGKPFGLFKTFQHNYLSHLVETIKTAKTTGETGPMLAFLGQMIFAAGIYGTIAIESADALLDKLSPYISKYTGKPVKGLKETILTSSYPSWVKYGIPSGATGIDFTSTLAAPGQAVTDLVSVPALDTLGLTPLPGKFMKEKTVIPSTFNYMLVALSSKEPDEKRLALLEWLNSFAPTSMRVFIEQHYNGLPMGWFESTSIEKLAGEGKLDPEHMFAYNQQGLYKDFKKKGRGNYYRSSLDWTARKWAAYSIEEQELLKAVYSMTRLKRNLKDNMDTVTASAAHHFMADGFVPWHLYERARQFGVLPGSFKTRILNRVELMNTTIIDRTLKRSKSLRFNENVKELRDIINSKYFFAGQE